MCAEKFPIVLAPNYAARVRLDRSEKENAVKYWGIGRGLYFEPFNSQQSFVWQFETDHLYGTEVVLAQQVKKAIEANKEQEHPCVFVDFGGSFGGTWCKLAKMYEKDIREGRALFIVTDLSLSKNKIREVISDPKSRLLTADEKEVVKQGIDLVHWINADAARLWRNPVTIDGKTIDLRKGVALLHEHYTLKHSNVAETDVYLLSQLIQSTGVMLISSNTVHNTTGEYSNDAQSGLTSGLQSLLKGSTLNTIPVSERYFAFVGKENKQPNFLSTYESSQPMFS